MESFAHLTKTAFENYHNMPYEPAKWSLSDAIGHIMQFLEHHDHIDEMTGLREAMYALTPAEWDIWAESYPTARATIIEPLRQEIATQQS